MIMFTGLIQQVCSVRSLMRKGDTAVLTVDLGRLAGQPKIGLPPRLASRDAEAGDSIAINGVCLTVASQTGSSAAFDISAETLSKTNLGRLSAGSKVNVELALMAGDQIGGHIVQGHIDGTATIKAIKKKGDFATFRFAAGRELLAEMVVKGSVAVDGISLTVADMDQDGFSAAVIPQTLKQTTLGCAKIDDVVNIETDIIVKTVHKYLKGPSPGSGGLTIDKLQDIGF